MHQDDAYTHVIQIGETHQAFRSLEPVSRLILYPSVHRLIIMEEKFAQRSRHVVESFLRSVDITWTDDGTVIRGLRRRWWAQRRFVACNEHVHPLSLTSTLPCYIWPVSCYIHLSRAYVGHPQIPSCFLNVKYGRLASRVRLFEDLSSRGKCSLPSPFIFSSVRARVRKCACAQRASCGFPWQENWSAEILSRLFSNVN